MVWLSRLMMWQKLSVLIVLGLVMFAVPMFLVLQAAQVRTDVAALELAGVKPVADVTELVQNLQKHRGVSNVLLSGNAAAAVQREALMQAIKKNAAEIEKIVSAMPALKPNWEALTKQWEALEKSVASRSIKATEAFASHTELIAKVIFFTEEVADVYGLTLDPEANGYFLQNAIVIHAPNLVEGLAQQRGKGAGYLAAGSLSDADRATLLSLTQRVALVRQSLSSQMAKAAQADPQLKAALATSS